MAHGPPHRLPGPSLRFRWAWCVVAAAAFLAGCRRDRPVTPPSPALLQWLQDSVEYERAVLKWHRNIARLDSIAATIDVDSLVALYRAIELQRGDPVRLIQETICEKDRILMPYGQVVAGRAFRRAQMSVWASEAARQRAHRRIEPRVPNGTVFSGGPEFCGDQPQRDSVPIGDLPRDFEPVKPTLRPRPKS